MTATQLTRTYTHAYIFATVTTSISESTVHAFSEVLLLLLLLSLFFLLVLFFYLFATIAAIMANAFADKIQQNKKGVWSSLHAWYVSFVGTHAPFTYSFSSYYRWVIYLLWLFADCRCNIYCICRMCTHCQLNALTATAEAKPAAAWTVELLFLVAALEGLQRILFKKTILLTILIVVVSHFLWVIFMRLVNKYVCKFNQVFWV